MKVGILTFHWAANHGAILQAYAMQKYLKSITENAEIEIIDYYPSRYQKKLLKCFFSRHIKIIKARLLEYKKEKKMAPFREKLDKTCYYPSEKSLKMGIKDFDMLISGSDQVWNEFFTTKGENQKKPSFAYYLSFGGNAKKISYAASFGYSSPKSYINDMIKPYLEKFDAISVREKTGIDILESMGLTGEIVCDPTLLLTESDYSAISSCSINNKFVSYYFLRWNNDRKMSIINSAKQNTDFIFCDLEKESIEEWLGKINNSEYVLTNSFHAVVFSLIFHKKFLFFSENNSMSGMNDRVYTLLDLANLPENIVENISDVLSKLNALKECEINWNAVDEKISVLVNKSKEFLLNNLN